MVGLTAGLGIGKNVPYHTHSLAGTTKACEFVINVMPSNPSPKHPSICLPMVFTDFSQDAPWRSTLRSHQDYLNTTPVAQRNSLD